MSLLEKLRAIRPEDLDRDAAEYFTGVAWDRDTFTADGEAIPIPKLRAEAEAVLVRLAPEEQAPAPRRVRIEDL